MTDFLHGIEEELRELINRLASDTEGEVLASVQAIRGKLDEAGLDLHDLSERLAQDKVRKYKRFNISEIQVSDLIAIVADLDDEVFNELDKRERDLVITCGRLLEAGDLLSPKQKQWLIDLHRIHFGDGGGE